MGIFTIDISALGNTKKVSYTCNYISVTIVVNKVDKILTRLLRKPKDFSYDELTLLLRYFGYEELKTGKTTGSRRAFVHLETKHIIRFHKPHPGNELKRYQINE